MCGIFYLSIWRSILAYIPPLTILCKMGNLDFGVLTLILLYMFIYENAAAAE